MNAQTGGSAADCGVEDVTSVLCKQHTLRNGAFPAQARSITRTLSHAVTIFLAWLLLKSMSQDSKDCVRKSNGRHSSLHPSLA